MKELHMISINLKKMYDKVSKKIVDPQPKNVPRCYIVS